MKCPECDTENADDAETCIACGGSLEEAREVQALIGTTVAERYRITRVIGIGGMGVVYEAEQHLGEHVRHVALKTLHPALARDAVVVSRFQRECAVVASLEHPNTIKFFDFGQTPDGMLYIVMELVRGKPLTDLIAAGAISVERTLGILRQVCGALEEAHEHGIVHRDLKPDNIILSSGREDLVKLLDFGIAARVGAGTKAETKLTQQGTVLGTPPYMSPEQFMGKELDRRSDVYALGVIAYEMLSARLPFTADTPFEWAVRHMTAPPEPPPASVPDAIRSTLMWALEKEPTARPQTARAFFQALEAAASGVVVLGRESTLPESRPMTTEDRRIAVAQPMSSASPDGMRTQPVAWVPGVPAPASSGSLMVSIGTPVSTTAPTVRVGRQRRVWPLLIASAIAGASIMLGIGLWRRHTHRQDAVTPSAPLSAIDSAPRTLEPLDDGAAEPFFPPPQVPANTGGKHTPTGPGPSAAPVPSGFPFPFPIPTVPPVATTAPVPTLPPPPATTSPPPPATTPPPPTTAPPPATTPPPPATTPPPPASNTGDPACVEANNLAQSNRIEAAVAAYRRCEQGGSARLQQTARERIRQQAANATRQRAFNNDCAGARSAVTAAQSIGAGDRAATVLASTRCK